ncbi:MAG: glycosyltransferase family 2 protein [Cyanobacteria bacterium P01_D01_bin.105]
MTSEQAANRQTGSPNMPEATHEAKEARPQMDLSKANQSKEREPKASELKASESKAGGLDINIEYSATEHSATGHSAAAHRLQPDVTSQQWSSPSELPLYFLSVNYYSAALLSDLMHTLESNQGVVIVNNSPSDRSVHGLAQQTYAGGQVTVLDAPGNDGFGAGCNLGLQWIYARSPNALVWLINPDTCLMPNAVNAIRQCFQQQVHDQNIAILGTPVLDAGGSVWFSAGQFNRWTGSVSSSTKIKSVKSKAATRGRPTSTQWVSGCSIVFNLGELGHCPQFDNTYFLYYEDCDLCERYRQKGYIVAIAPVPLVVHAVSSITSRYPSSKYVHATFSKLTFLRRHATPLALGLNLIYLLAQSIILRFIKPAVARGRWIGIQHFLRGSRTHPAAASNYRSE